MLKIESLQDRFTTASLDTSLWQDTTALSGSAFGTPIVYGYGLLSLPGGSIGSSGICSTGTFDLQDSAISAELVDQSQGDNYILVQNMTSGNGASWVAGIHVEAILGGVIASALYDSTIHRFFRIVETGGTLYWDYSRDGSTWHQFTSHPATFDTSSVQASIYSDGIGLGTYSSQWANVGFIPASQRQACPSLTSRS